VDAAEAPSKPLRRIDLIQRRKGECPCPLMRLRNSKFSGDVSTWDVPSGMNVTNMFKDADAFNARFACDDVDNWPPNTCTEKAYPISLAHRLDFSESRFVETTSGGIVTSFTDVAGKATNARVFSSPTYERHVHAGLNGITFSSDGAYLSMIATGSGHHGRWRAVR